MQGMPQGQMQRMGHWGDKVKEPSAAFGVGPEHPYGASFQFVRTRRRQSFPRHFLNPKLILDPEIGNKRLGAQWARAGNIHEGTGKGKPVIQILPRYSSHCPFLTSIPLEVTLGSQRLTSWFSSQGKRKRKYHDCATNINGPRHVSFILTADLRGGVVTPI